MLQSTSEETNSLISVWSKSLTLSIERDTCHHLTQEAFTLNLGAEALFLGNPPGTLTDEEAGGVLVQEEVGGPSLAGSMPFTLLAGNPTAQLQELGAGGNTV